MTQTQRIHSIDILRGVGIFLVIFFINFSLSKQNSVNQGLSVTLPVIPALSWIIPGLLFTFGMTIPFSISGKIASNDSTQQILRSIFSHTIVLLVIGILMVNISRVNSELTGINKEIWAILALSAIFLVWKRYQEKDDNFFTIIGLRFLGLSILIVLVFKFRSGSFENGGSIIPGWWEIPGLIGWGFFVSAIVYLLFRNSIFRTVLILVFFIALTILDQFKQLDFLAPVIPYFGPVLKGYIPAIFISGQLAGIVLRKYSSSEYRKTIYSLGIIAISLLVAGFVLKEYIFKGFFQENSGISLISCGIALCLFIPIYLLADVKMNDKWFSFIKPAGENGLMTYIISSIIYHLILLTGLPVLFYRNSGNIIILITGSIIWAMIIVVLSSVLRRLDIRLKI
jgi:heparan-alpha-glucosaminide N-acetyltransferase